jgi:hypothetical protein
MSRVIDDLNKYNCPSCGVNLNHKSIVIAIEAKVATLEAELSGLRSVAQSAKDNEGGPDLCQDNFR